MENHGDRTSNKKFFWVWGATQNSCCMFTFCYCSSNISSMLSWQRCSFPPTTSRNDNKLCYSRLYRGHLSYQWGSRFRWCGIWAATRFVWVMVVLFEGLWWGGSIGMEANRSLVAGSQCCQTTMWLSWYLHSDGVDYNLSYSSIPHVCFACTWVK